jgi:integrase/recombinase XerC
LPPRWARLIAGSTRPLVERYLEHVRVEKRLAARTVELYALDLQKLPRTRRRPACPAEVHNAHVRRWVAQMHGAGRSGRGIALILSGWRGFYTWLGREGLVKSNPVQDVKAPKAPKPLPKALGVDDAVQLADFSDDEADPWLEARDAAIVELLYGCGLRVGELVGLDAQASGSAKGWVDLQAGEAHVLGKGSKRRRCRWARQGAAGAAGIGWRRAAPGAHGGQALFIGRTRHAPDARRRSGSG